MPNRDRTGPEGQGPMTGRGLGLCENGEYFKCGARRGFGFRRRGLSRGFGWRFFGNKPVKFAKEL